MNVVIMLSAEHIKHSFSLEEILFKWFGFNSWKIEM